MIYRILRMMRELFLIVIVSGCLDPALSIERAIDGDTIELSNGDVVRLLCVNTPEDGEEGYERAKHFTSNFSGSNITLEKDISERDRYGRLLRIVHVEGLNRSLNQMLIDEGYAEELIIEPDINLC